MESDLGAQKVFGVGVLINGVGLDSESKSDSAHLWQVVGYGFQKNFVLPNVIPVAARRKILTVPKFLIFERAIALSLLRLARIYVESNAINRGTQAKHKMKLQPENR